MQILPPLSSPNDLYDVKDEKANIEKYKLNK